MFCLQTSFFKLQTSVASLKKLWKIEKSKSSLPSNNHCCSWVYEQLCWLFPLHISQTLLSKFNGCIIFHLAYVPRKPLSFDTYLLPISLVNNATVSICVGKDSSSKTKLKVWETEMQMCIWNCLQNSWLIKKTIYIVFKN